MENQPAESLRRCEMGLSNEEIYLMHTNLAKLRIADHIIRDVLFMDASKDEKTKEISNQLYKWICEYEKEIDPE